jgi:positive regulator of sigma E activity
MRSVSVQYLLPLFGMFLFVLAATFVSSGLVIQLLGAISGLVVGVLASKYLIRWYESSLDDEHLRIRHPVS